MAYKKIYLRICYSVTALIVIISFFWIHVLWFFLFFGPIFLLGFFDMIQKKHAILKNYPVIGHLRYIFEEIRPEIMQYFVETNTEGRPINRIYRSLVYERAKGINDTTPFGTQMEIYKAGYEWIDHSMYAKNKKIERPFPRVIIGGKDCKQPYSASLLNISAMSFGALSDNAVLALNKGAKEGKFAHNTGEGGLSKYHLEPGGDIIWQIGTAYFGCRTEDGNFDEKLFQEKSNYPQVKMIEIKLSQGAKPGHGGILPAIKNTPEIAKIRNIKPHIDVHSPPSHTAFSNPIEFVHFIKKLRDLSGGKPVGFKLCVGKKQEFIDVCKAMVKTGIKPDFITVDGGEGGTGAAPVEFSNSVGFPLRDGLVFVTDTLTGFDLKKDIKVIASGKILSSFHIARVLALGADLCNSARGMMLSLGCIQSLKCNKNTCPTGVATQNQTLVKGLDVEKKAKLVEKFHSNTVFSLLELIAATGVDSHTEIERKHVMRRINMNNVMSFAEVFPELEPGCFINEKNIPHRFAQFFVSD
ncbi:FMN-binding glutamate synthase family protein [Aureivirga marina]|uniref:FMN-binding glutamate synthase family protein n=1 Tax=Aureivirga marina TaxID=1182451 RepID=UPI0018C95A1C|nr:FMN-binding glutamate synthase family protein [Aureivirga marina]